MSVACNHLTLSLRVLYHDQSVSTLNPTLTTMVAAPGLGSEPNTTDTWVSDGQYYGQRFRISFLANPRSPTSPGRASKPESSGEGGDDTHAMSDHDICMSTFSGSDKNRGLDSESRQEEGQVRSVDGEYGLGEAL